MRNKPNNQLPSGKFLCILVTIGKLHIKPSRPPKPRDHTPSPARFPANVPQKRETDLSTSELS